MPIEAFRRVSDEPMRLRKPRTYSALMRRGLRRSSFWLASKCPALSLKRNAPVSFARDTGRIWRAAPRALAFAVLIGSMISPAVTLALDPQQIHDGPVSILFYDSKRRLFSAGWDGTVRRWLNPSAKVSTVMKVPVGRVTAVVVCDEEDYIVVASSDDWLHRFEISTGVRQGSLEPTRQIGIRSMALSKECREIVLGSSDQALRRWRIEDGKDVVRPRMLDAGALRPMLPSPTEPGRLAIGTRKVGVLLWSSSDSSAPVVLKRKGNNRVTALVWRPDGRQLAAAYADRSIVLWDAINLGQPVELSAVHRDDIKGLAYALEGTRLLSADLLGVILSHRLGTKEEPCVIMRLPEQSGVMSMAVHPNTRTMAAGTLLGEVFQWRIADLLTEAGCK